MADPFDGVVCGHLNSGIIECLMTKDMIHSIC